MKPITVNAIKNEAGEKELDVLVYGVIAKGWSDTVDAAVIAKELAANRDAKAITVHINSMGGDMFDGIAIHNLLKGHGAPVTSIVEGWAASAASIIAMTGKTVMGSGAMMLIHNPWTIVMGDATELRRVAADLDKARDSLVAIYKAKTGKDGAELRSLLAAETLMTAEQAKRQGFADEIASDSDDPIVEDQGDSVVFNGCAFPRTSLPAHILAMATPRPPGNNPPRGEENDMTIDRKLLEAKAPELMKALLEEGRAAGLEEGKKAGVSDERARLQAIDDLGLRGCEEMITAAKYGDKPQTAEQLAVAAIRASKAAGLDVLEARRRESEEAASVRQTAPKGSGELGSIIDFGKSYAQALAAKRERK